MEHNSSTSHFKRESLLWSSLAAGIGLLWIGYLLGGAPLADFVNAQIGTWLEAMSKGRIVDSRLFILQIEKETLQLLTAPVIVSGLMRWIYISAKSIVPFKLRGLLATFLVLILLNTCLVVARDTTLFWGGIFFAYPNLKQSAFHFERNLLATAPDTQEKVVVIGSSQGRSQIDTGQLDRTFTGRARFGNLSYAGADAIDFTLFLDHISTTGANTIICYVSEINFYDKRISASRFLPLLNLKRIPWALSLARQVDSLDSKVHYGILAAVLPMFQVRRAVELAIFGRLAEKNFSVPIKRRRPIDKPTITKFERRAQGLSMNTYRSIQKTAFVQFIKEAKNLGIRVVIIQGQINPEVSSFLPPAMRIDFEAFLQEVTSGSSNVTLLTDELPSHMSEDYEDSTHVWHHVRKNYTLEVSKVLRLHNYF